MINTKFGNTANYAQSGNTILEKSLTLVAPGIGAAGESRW